jgi:acyl carrier protein
LERTEILERVKKVIADVLRSKIEQITENSRIKDDLGADSLDRVTLLMAFEDAFKEQISDEEAANLVTVEDVVGFIHDRLQNKTRSI